MSESLLAGLKVVDCATVIAGPAAAMMLADFGADVIKIERPGRGDMLRILSNMPGTTEAGKNYMWQMDGRNKRSIALELESEAALAVLHQLAAQCDVFITNMPYPQRERFQITYDDLKQFNPNHIYASLTAYGENGPERDRKSFDQLAYWARSGLMDLMREPGTVPAQGLPGMGDHPTAVSIYAGIMTALLHRERTGEGSFVHTSLLANGLWSNAATAQGVLAGGEIATHRRGETIPGYTMRVYRTKDDRWLQLNMVRNEDDLSLLFTALDAIELLADERFETPMKMYRNRAVLGELIQEIIVKKTSDDWMAIFDQLNVAVNRVALVEEIATDAQVQRNRLTTQPMDFECPPIVNHPIQVDTVVHSPMTKAPNLGEHTREILTELGYSQADTDSLIASGAVTEPESG